MRTDIKLKMHLESDAIFSRGMTGVDGTDLVIMCDKDGFPYYKGSSFKGIFREMMENYLLWTEQAENSNDVIQKYLGNSGDATDGEHKMIFSDFVLSKDVRLIIKNEFMENTYAIQQVFTSNRVFTEVTDGMTKEGSLRTIGVINKGINFYSTINCAVEDVNR